MLCVLLLARVTDAEVAELLTTVTAAPSCVVPSKNFTVPVKTEPETTLVPEAVIVAVKVVGVPVVRVAGSEVRVVTVLPWLTIKFAEAELEVA